MSLPFFRKTQLIYPRYVVRRVCRIYIPFAVTVLLALSLYTLAGPPHAPDATEWFNNELWPSERPGISVIAAHFLMIGTDQDIQLNPAFWTLVYEMRISLLFPLLILLCRDSRIGLVGGLVLLKLSAKALSEHQHHPAHAESFGITLLWTAQIIPYFLTGILLSKHREQLHRLSERIPKALAVALFVIPAFAFMVQGNFVLAKIDALYAFGAAVLIMLAVENAGFRAFLNHRLPQWLGRISYSTYLIHLPLMLAVTPALLGLTPPIIAAAVLIGLSLAAATLMHVLVEVPAIKLGRRLTRRTKVIGQSVKADA